MNKLRILLQALMGIFGIAILGVGWHYTSEQADALIETNIVVYQQVELELARVAAHNFGGYIQNQDERDKALLMQDAYENIVFPISLLENGYAWVYSPDYAVFRHEDLSPLGFSDKTIHEIFEMQRVNGASHFNEVAASITEASEGVGWYVWQAKRGKEITAWAPIQIGDDVWVIGVSTPLSEILEMSGTAGQIDTMRKMAGMGTVLFLGMVLLVNSIGLEQQRALTRLQASEERHRLLFNSAPDGVSILDRKGTILECSQSMAELYGYSAPKELVGKNLTELMSIDSLKVFQEKIHLLQNLESAEGEIKIVRPDGSFVDIWRKGHPVTDAQGNFSGILSYDRDISERVRVESEYKKLHQAVKQSANAIVITDVDGAIEYVNPKFLQVTGYTEEEIIGENPRVLKSGEHSKEFYEKMWDTLTSKNEWHGEFCNKRKDGSINWESANITPVISESGEITNYIAIKEDITHQIYIEQELQKSYRELEIKVAERTVELKESEQKFSAAFHAAPYLMAITKPDSGFIIDVNQVFAKTFEYEREELIGKSTLSLQLWESPILRNSIIRSTIENEMVRRIEMKTQTKTGKPIWILFSAQEIVISGERHLVSVAIDITERKKLEEKLHQQATTDPLTKIYNRRYFFAIAQQELERSQRYNHPLSIIIFDIDYFKKVNDAHGHAVGDDVLCKLTSDCLDNLRENDIFARYGGEEFVILLPETNEKQAKQMAERIRKGCAETPLDIGVATVNITISLGVSSLNGKEVALDQLLLRADKALYQAKEGGRNRVSVWESRE